MPKNRPRSPADLDPGETSQSLLSSSEPQGLPSTIEAEAILQYPDNLMQELPTTQQAEEAILNDVDFFDLPEEESDGFLGFDAQDVDMNEDVNNNSSKRPLFSGSGEESDETNKKKKKKKKKKNSSKTIASSSSEGISTPPVFDGDIVVDTNTTPATVNITLQTNSSTPPTQTDTPIPRKNASIPQSNDASDIATVLESQIEENAEPIPEITQTETPKSNVILIRPTERSIQDGFFKNRVKIYRLLENSDFKKYGILETKPNLQRQIQVVKIENTTQIESLLQIKMLGEYEVDCYLPSTTVYKVGLIGPIEYDVEVEDLIELLQETGFSDSKAKRLVIGSKENRRESKTMKIWFKSDTLPENVTLMYQRFSVTPYIEKPWQCFKCQKFGHSAKFCKGKDICVICTGSHNYKDCPSKGDNTKRKCINCGGDHTANFSGCQKMIQEKEVQRMRINKNISYRDAVKLAKRQEQTNIQAAPIQQCTTQTENIHNKTNGNQTETSTHLTTWDNNTMTKFALCILDIFSSFQKTDNLSKKCSIITNAFSSHLNVEIDKTRFFNQIKPQIQKNTQQTTQQATSSQITNSRLPMPNSRRNDRPKL